MSDIITVPMEELVLRLAPAMFKVDQFVRKNANYEVIEHWNDLLRDSLRTNELLDLRNEMYEDTLEIASILAALVKKLGHDPETVVADYRAKVAADIEKQDLIETVEKESPPEHD